MSSIDNILKKLRESRVTEAIDLEWHRDYVKSASIEDLRAELSDIKSKLDAAKSPESEQKWADLHDIYKEEIKKRSKKVDEAKSDKIVTLVIDEDKLYDKMFDEGYDEDRALEFIQDFYDLEDGEDFQVGNGFELLIRPSVPKEKIEKIQRELGEDKTPKEPTKSIEDIVMDEIFPAVSDALSKAVESGLDDASFDYNHGCLKGQGVIYIKKELDSDGTWGAIEHDLEEVLEKFGYEDFILYDSTREVAPYNAPFKAYRIFFKAYEKEKEESIGESASSGVCLVIDSTVSGETERYRVPSREAAEQKVEELVDAGSDRDKISIKPLSREDSSKNLSSFSKDVMSIVNDEAPSALYWKEGDIIRNTKTESEAEFKGYRKNYVGTLQAILNTEEGEIKYSLSDLQDEIKNGTLLNKSSKTRESIVNESEDTDSIANEIRVKVKEAVKKFMMSPRCGFPEDEVDDYSRVDVEFLKEENGNYIKLEVGAELSFGAISDLCDELNPIVSQYDEDSYFEPEQPGIITAYITV